MSYRYNFWNASKEVELVVTTMTGGTDEQEVLQLKYQPQRQWMQYSTRWGIFK